LGVPEIISAIGPAAITCGWWNFITPGALGSRISLRRAMAKGTRFGRRPKLTKHQAREALKRVAAGETLCEIALSYNVDHSTIYRLKAR